MSRLVANITGILARYNVMWVVLSIAIIIMSASDVANADLNRESVDIDDLPVTITLSEPTNFPVGTTIPGEVLYLAEGCKPVVFKGLAEVQKNKRGIVEIFWKIELNEDLLAGDYRVTVMGDRPFFKELRLFDLNLGNSNSPKFNCADTTHPILAGSKSKSTNIFAIFESSDKNDPPSLNSLYIVVAISAITIASIIYLRRATPPEGKMSYTVEDPNAFRGSVRPILSDTIPVKIFRMLDSRWGRTILNNTAVASTYLLVMSFISTSGALFFREYFITRFGLPPPTDFMVGQWLDWFFAEDLLFHASANITHPNLYLFYAIFFLPFMIRASKIFLGSYARYDQSWRRKIRNYIIVYFIVTFLLTLFFMWYLGVWCNYSAHNCSVL